MKNDQKNSNDIVSKLNNKLDSVGTNDLMASREDLSYDTAQLNRGSVEGNTREERELTGQELERRKHDFIAGLRRSPIPDLTPVNPKWQFVLGSEAENASPSLYDLLSKGYTYVRPEDCKENVSHLLVKHDNEHSGFLRRREMVYLKIEKVLYDTLLEEVHHNLPALKQEGAYASYAQSINGSSKGKRAGAKYSMGGEENVYDDSDEIKGYFPGWSEQNGVGKPKAFTAPRNWDNVGKKNIQGE